MKKLTQIFLLLSLVGMFLVGCGSTEGNTAPEVEEDLEVKSTYVEPLADSLDEAIIMNVNAEESRIQFYNITLGKPYSLFYDQATIIKDKFGEDLVAGQLTPGDMVYVTFIKEDHLAKSILFSDEVVMTENVSEFEINNVARTMVFGGDQYDLCKNMVVLAEGKEIEVNELTPTDTLRIAVKDHTVYGIDIAVGHGYVRLTGQESFVDGFVEIGKIILKITDEMLIPVPVGAYSMFISKDGIVGSEDIEIKAGEEVTVDVSKFDISEDTKTGKIVFTISPSKATLFIDGKETDYSAPVELTCGIHQVRVKADGYKTFTQYIKVGQTASNLNIELEEKGINDKDDEEEEQKTVSKNSVPVEAATGYRVYVDTPVSAEVYLDGNYVGKIPTSFPKKAGTYVLSIRREGFQTRSVTLQIDNSKKDISYSFSELAMNEEEEKKQETKVESDAKSEIGEAPLQEDESTE